jgi:hypothetical protein
MQPKEKIALMDKIIRELDDLINSQTSVLKKISQIEAENINLNDSSLSDALPDVHEHVDAALVACNGLKDKFKEVRDDFVAKNPVSEE